MSPLLHKVLNELDQLTMAEQLQVMEHLAQQLKQRLTQSQEDVAPTTEDDEWDRQMAKDVEEGKLDHLIARAEAAIQSNQITSLEKFLENPLVLPGFKPLTRDEIYDR